MSVHGTDTMYGLLHIMLGISRWQTRCVACTLVRRCQCTNNKIRRFYVFIRRTTFDMAVDDAQGSGSGVTMTKICFLWIRLQQVGHFSRKIPYLKNKQRGIEFHTGHSAHSQRKACQTGCFLVRSVGQASLGKIATKLSDNTKYFNLF